jgi:hypothetical protein
METVDRWLDLYHRTDLESARSILRTGRFRSRENTGEAYFSNAPTGAAVGYGEAVVHIRVPVEMADLEDEFPDGEQHYRVRPQRIRPEHIIGAEGT